MHPSLLQDELARVFVSLFDAKRLLYQLLWNMFSKEVTGECVCVCVRGGGWGGVDTMQYTADELSAMELS